MVTEQTQFSMTELHEFLKNDSAPEASSLNKREKAMDAFSKALTGRDFEPYGGEGNIQRVRVLADPATPEVRRYEFITKLPIDVLARKAADEKRAAVLAEVKRLESDPKALAEFVRKEAYKFLDRMVTLALLDLAKAASRPVRPSKPARSSKPQPKPVRKPQPKQDAYAKALEQDRQNRIKAAKEASLARRAS